MFLFETLGRKVTEVKIEGEKVKRREGDEESDIQTQKSVQGQSWLRMFNTHYYTHAHKHTNPTVCSVMRSEQKGMRGWREREGCEEFVRAGMEFFT